MVTTTTYPAATAAYPTEVACVPRAGTLYDVMELILDRGMVIDVFIRVSLVGIEILKIDVRICVASVDTYLRFAEACNRLDLETDTRSRTVPELFGGMGGSAVKSAGKRKVKKTAESVGGKVREAVGMGGESDEEEEETGEEETERPRRRKTSGSASRRRSREG